MNHGTEIVFEYWYCMTRILSALSFILCFAACTNNKAEKPTAIFASPQYYFYPKANVYFDSANKDYVFMGNDGKTWQSEKQIPAAMQALMDKSILIDSPAQPVWKDNERHKLIYSAALYTAPSDTQVIKPVVPVIKPEPPKTEVKKGRKGFRRFLDKIFGRKKKDTAGN